MWTAVAVEALLLLVGQGIAWPDPPSDLNDTLLGSEGEACSAADVGGGAGSADCGQLHLMQTRARKTMVAREGDGAGGASPIPEVGVLNLFGYFYPTQPGDVNDLRTYCHVKPEDVNTPFPKCAQPLAEGHFGVSFASLGAQNVQEFTFEVSTDPAKASSNVGLLPAVKEGLRYLLKKPEVKAITCNVGFCAELQPLAQRAMDELVAEENLATKPALLGSPALLPLFHTAPGKKTALDRQTEAIIVLTSFYPALTTKNLLAILTAAGAKGEEMQNMTIPKGNALLEKHMGIMCHDHNSMACASVVKSLAACNATILARNIVVIGWNNAEGYVPVDSSGGFHNVNLTLESYAPQVQNAVDYLHYARGLKVKAIVMESTEMPAHANKVRMDFKVPVFDITTVAKCVMKAAPSWAASHPPGFKSKVFLDLYHNSDFLQCAEDLFDPLFIEPLFGTQTDGSLKFYEGLSRDEVRYLTCTGGDRPLPATPLGRSIALYDQGHPYPVGSLNPVCMLTAVGMCPGVAADGFSCPGPIPGGANCGGGGFGPQLNPRVKGVDFPCGADGALCASFADVPPLNFDPKADKDNSNACAIPAPSKGFTFQKTN
mmetsp:Transcript_35319/g.93221  ORF Transcript_35319/g.93221 Transcript_35319/m.93221 type:complete len:601 (-) Transcript_35319:59-1861(-)